MKIYTIITTVFACMLCGHSADATVQPVEKKGGEVSNVGDMANKIDNNDAEASSGTAQQIAADTVKLNSPIFEPPASNTGTNFKFIEFKNSTTRIDIELDPSAIMPARDKDEDFEIQFSATVTLTNAGVFPLQGEGNLNRIAQKTSTRRGTRLGQEIFRHWSAKVSKTIADLDIRESQYTDNRVGPRDPRPHPTSTDKIVLWHLEGTDSVQLDLIKPPAAPGFAAPGTFRVRVEDLGGRNAGVLPSDVALANNSVTYTLDVAMDSVDADILVKYGVDVNNDGVLGHSEVIHQYTVYGVTTADYSDARRRLDIALRLALTDMADVLVRRFRDGAFQPGNNYNPTSTANTAALNADRLTHYFGASTFANQRFKTINDRQYFEADATFPIFKWDVGSAGSDLVRTSDSFEDGIKNWIAGQTFNQIDAAYQAAPGPGAKRAVSLGNVKAKFSFGATGDIGLGGASSTGGALVVEVEPDGANYKIHAGCSVANVLVEDLFDYNYFNPAGAVNNASISAASVQCGYGKPGSVANAGQVGLVRIEVTGTVATPEITITP